MLLEMEFSYTVKKDDNLVDVKISSFLKITPTSVEYREPEDLSA